MRVTQSMLSTNMVNNLGKSYDRLGKLQEQMNTQKKFTKPSDDPVAASMGMTYRSNVNEVEQYKRNIGEAINWVESTDSALSQSINALQKIRELTVQASNGTYEENQVGSMKDEIKELQEHIKDIGETQVGGKYIFNGQNTNVRPDANDPNSFMDSAINLEVFSGITIQINTEGKELFGDTLKDGGFFDGIYAALEGNDEKEISKQLDVIDAKIDQFLSTQAQVGARQNRVELMESRLGEQEVFAKKILSNNEDIDIEKTILELTTQESIHSAALAVGAKVIQPSLLDFLR